MTRALLSISGVLWVVIPTFCVVGWVSFFRRQRQGQTAVPFESRDPVPWGFVDLVLILLAAVLIQGVGVSILAKPRSAVGVGILAGATAGGVPEINLARIGVFSFSTLAAWAASLALVHWRSGATGRDFGLPILRRDIRLGFVAFAMLIVPVFFVQYLLSLYVSESKHPLIDSLLANPDNVFFAVAGFAAVVVAPIVEEFFFRVYFQGWLEKLDYLRRGRGALAMNTPDTPGRDRWGTDFLPEAESNPNHTELLTESTDAQAVPLDSLEARPAWWPIVCSSLLFAAAHFGHGPDPIPLFFLALGLGYLYQRTHRVWPCITVHCLVNLTSLYLLWALVHTKPA